MAENQSTINQWQRATFGNVTPESAVARMNVEVAELIYKVNTHGSKSEIGFEMADVYVVLCQLADAVGVSLDDFVVGRNRRLELAHFGQ